MNKPFYTFILILFATSAFSQIVDIPDPGFKEFLIFEGVDTNDDGEIQESEVAEIEILLIYNANNITINSIEGVKSFTSLIYLDIDYIDISTVDIAGMQNLETLNITTSNLANIDAKDCIKLKSVSILEPVNSADFSGCTSLQSVDWNICADFLKFNNCTSLKRIAITNCMVFDLELMGCDSLTYIEASDLNPDFEFDLSGLSALDTFILMGHNIGNLEVLNLPNLEFINIYEVRSFTVRNCPNLEEVMLSIADNVDIVGLPKLSTFSFLQPTPSELKIEDCPVLQSFVLYGEFGKIYIKNCPSIETLEFMGGTVPELWNFTGLSSLTSINAPYGPDEMVLDGCYNLESFSIGLTNAKIYDFSPCINLKTLILGDIFYTENLILQNGSIESVFLTNISNLKNVCVDPEQLVQIQNLLDPLPNNSATVTTNCAFANGGKPFKISGTSYLDTNNDSCNTSTTTLPFSKYKISDEIIGERFFYSNESGQYTYNVIEGEYSFGPELLFGDYIFTSFPENRSINFPLEGTEVVQDFCFIPNPAEVDVIEVNLIPIGGAIPGFDSKYLITYTNTGNVTRGGEIKFTFQDEFMDFVSSEPSIDVQNEGFLSWSFEDLVPYETRNIEFTMNLNSPMETPPLNSGDVLNFRAEVGPLGNQTLTVYWSNLNQEVVNSLDPNDKTCLSGSTFDQELVGDYLKFMIRFENTGTAEAVNIVVTDTLDGSKLDINTLHVINSSHEVETELIDNVVKFVFKDIYLPFEDETNDGYVTFKIKTLSTLELGEDIRNKAEIYFDFNFPIVTNTTSTIVSDFTSTIDLKSNTFEIEIFPNPSSKLIYIHSENQLRRIELFDTAGKQIEIRNFTSTNNFQQLSIDHLIPGVYFIKGFSENGFSVKKLVKE